MGCCWCTGNGRVNTHAYTTTFTCTEHLSSLECLHALWNVDEDVAAILHQVLFPFSEVTLSSTVYLSHTI